MAETLLALRHVLVRHGESTVLEIAMLDLQEGEILGIIGPNGAGKSTLLRVMGLLQQPTTGKVYFDGVEANRQNSLRLRRCMASVFQEPLLINASVFDNAALGLRLRGLRADAIDRQLLPWLERLGIADLASRPARSLSGGEAQRTSLARAFAFHPRLLLLDEPFSALDPPTRETLLLDLQTILRETGVAAVLVTHDRDEAIMLARRIGVLKAGRMLQLDSSREVFLRPASEAVAEIVGIENRIAGVVQSAAQEVATVRFNGGATQVSGSFEPGTRVILCIRPEDISVTRPDERHRSCAKKACLQAKIARVSQATIHDRLVLKCGDVVLVSFVDRASCHQLGLAEGDEVTACFSPQAVHVIKSQGFDSIR